MILSNLRDAFKRFDVLKPKIYLTKRNRGHRADLGHVGKTDFKKHAGCGWSLPPRTRPNVVPVVRM
jgi:hypothetical protein